MFRLRLRLVSTLVILVFTILRPSMAAADGDTLRFVLRSQTETDAGSQRFHVVEYEEEWAPSDTALIVCDAWDRHHSLNAVRRLGEFAPRLNDVLTILRKRGVVIIHAPSDCMPAYEGHPARQRVLDSPPAASPPVDIALWCNRIPEEEAAVYPVDQSDGGDDDEPREHAAWAARLAAEGRNPALPWQAQTSLLTIDPDRDYISDRGDEVWNILESRGVRQVIVAGVHANMCVLGRPFGLRQLVRSGKRVVLLRDMTDSMYNPQRWPWVSHFTGNDRIVDHIERWVCPTISSEQIVGGAPFRFSRDRRPHLAVVIAEDEYDSQRTLPAFVEATCGDHFRTSYLYGQGEGGHELSGDFALRDADAVLLYVRRKTPPAEQLARLRRFVASGKPVIALRTASHAFSLREGSPPPGADVWPEFDADVLGGHYTGHHPEGLEARITPAAGQTAHPVLTGLGAGEFRSGGSLYKTSPLAPGAVVLAMGQVDGHPPEPVAWTFLRRDGGRTFYTSLGHVSDFENTVFRQLLRNAIAWATDQPLTLLASPDGLLRRWTPATVPGPFPALAGESPTRIASPVWLRAYVRLPDRSAAAEVRLEVDALAACGLSAWVNGQAAECSTRGGDNQREWSVQLPKEALLTEDANLIVLRVVDAHSSSVGSLRSSPQGLAGPPRLMFSGVGQHAADVPARERRLEGRWQFRLGDDEAWRSDPLPAKFAASTDVFYDLRSASPAP